MGWPKVLLPTLMTLLPIINCIIIVHVTKRAISTDHQPTFFAHVVFQRSVRQKSLAGFHEETSQFAF